MTPSSNSNHGSTNKYKSDDEQHDIIIHWAIVGLGDVCTIKSGPAFYKCHGSTLAAVMRRTPGAAREWIKHNAVSNLPRDVAWSIRAFDSVEQMIEDMSNGRDAIYVATPPGAHLENVRQIVSSRQRRKRNGIKAVYVEKPCGRCAWETRAMVDELHAQNIEFYPAYVSRAHERTQVLRQLLGSGGDDNKICGETITSIRYTQRGSSLARGLDNGDNIDSSTIPWRLNAKQSGGGLIMDMGCHVLDRIDYLFGPLENVKSTVLRKGSSSSSSYPLVEDYVSMSATIGECDWSAVPSVGAMVECVWDFSPREEEDVDELIISGPNGSLRMAGMGAGLPIEVLDTNGNIVKTIEFDAPKHAAQPLIQSVVDELLGHRPGGGGDLIQSPARADNAIRTSEVLDTILGPYYGGRHDEFWSRPETWPGLIAPPE
ncbi:hypothetical protein ACHAXR_005397 [Thalassiosira sp. AJA248-18]